RRVRGCLLFGAAIVVVVRHGVAIAEQPVARHERGRERERDEKEEPSSHGHHCGALKRYTAPLATGAPERSKARSAPYTTPARTARPRGWSGRCVRSVGVLPQAPGDRGQRFSPSLSTQYTYVASTAMNVG